MGSIIGLALAGARPPPPHPPTTLVSCLAGWANRASTTRAAGVAHANGVLLGSSAALVLGAGSWYASWDLRTPTSWARCAARALRLDRLKTRLAWVVVRIVRHQYVLRHEI